MSAFWQFLFVLNLLNYIKVEKDFLCGFVVELVGIMFMIENWKTYGKQ